MGQHTTGIVSTVAGSNIIVGYECGWVAAGIKSGDIIFVHTDNIAYTIGSNPIPISGDYESFTLTANYPVTRNSVIHTIVTDFTEFRNLPLIQQKELHFPDIYSRSMRMLDHMKQWGEDFCPHLYSYGLEFYYGEGFFILAPGIRVSITEGFVTLADNDTNYIEVNSLGTVSTNILGFYGGKIPLYSVVTSGGEISSVMDWRSPYRIDKCPALTLSYPAQMTNGVSNVDWIVRTVDGAYVFTRYEICADGLLAGSDVTLQLRNAEGGGGSGQNMILGAGLRKSGIQSLAAPLTVSADGVTVVRGDGKGISLVTIQLFIG